MDSSFFIGLSHEQLPYVYVNGIIYILGQDLYYANKFIKYNPIWDN